MRVNQCLTTGDYYYYRGTDSELNTLHLELFGHHRSPEGQVRIYYYYYYNFFFFLVIHFSESDLKYVLSCVYDLKTVEIFPNFHKVP